MLFIGKPMGRSIMNTHDQTTHGDLALVCRTFFTRNSWPRGLWCFPSVCCTCSTVPKRPTPCCSKRYTRGALPGGFDCEMVVWCDGVCGKKREHLVSPTHVPKQTTQSQGRWSFESSCAPVAAILPAILEPSNSSPKIVVWHFKWSERRRATCVGQNKK